MWIVYATLSAVTAALMTIAGKIGLKDVDPVFATGIRSFFMFVFMAFVVGFTVKTKTLTSLDQRALWTIVVSAILGALSWLFYFLALKTGQTSKVAAIDRFSLVLVILLSVVFLAEKLTLKLALGALFATIGIVLITIA